MVTENEMDKRLKKAEEICDKLLAAMYAYLETQDTLSTEELLLGITMFYQSIVMTQYGKDMVLTETQRDDIINKMLAQFDKETYLEDCVVTLVEALDATLMQIVTV